MGPYVVFNAALIGFFSFAGLCLLLVRWESRRDSILLLFAVHCALCAVFSGCILGLVEARTPAEGQRAFDLRLDIGFLIHITAVWLLSLLSGLRARGFVWFTTAALLAALFANVALEPLTGVVTASGPIVTPWGERLMGFHREGASRWLVPLYWLVGSVQVFGCVCAARLWRRDRLGGVLLASACIANLGAGVWGKHIDSRGIPGVYVGAGPFAAWVVFMMMHLARVHRQRADQLAAAERRFRGVFDQTFGLMALLAPDGTLVEANRTALDVGGLRPEAIVGKPFWQTEWWMHAAPLQARLREAVEMAAAGATERFEAAWAGADGRLHDVDFSVKPVRDDSGKVVLLLAEGRDITERKRAELALKERTRDLGAAEERYRLLASAAFEGIAVTRQGKVQEVNEPLAAMLGCTQEELRGRVILDFVAPESREAVAEYVRVGRMERYEHLAIRKDGSVFPVEARARAMTLAGEAVRVTAIRDLSEQREAEKALRASEEKYRHFFEQELAAHYVSAPDGRLLVCNEAFAHLLGFSSAAETMASDAASVYPADPSQRAALLARLAREGRVDRFETEVRRDDGTLVHVIVSAVAVVEGEPPALREIHGFLIDDTKRRKAEAEVQQAQKMDAIGRLAGGVAHDFNNILGVIIGFGELLLRKATPGERGKLEQILKAANRAASLTRQLLAFSRKQVVEPKVLDLNLLLSDMEKMLGRLMGEDIDFAIECGADLGQVKADPGQIEQVIMNLCVNARDAMPDGGRLRVETRNVRIDSGGAAVGEPMPSGRFVVLSVTDAGCGIAKGIIDNIFEPFFTTKEEGKGTGLGLSTVYGIVKQAGGHIRVESEVGRGTCFNIYLPRIDDPPEAPLEEEVEIPARGTETILLVEDDGSLREIAREILEENGYRVLEAANGEQATDIAQRHPDRIHLLVTDVVMPGMHGRALAESLASLRPGLEVLYMSGYTDDIIARRGVLEPGMRFIGKPFTELDLLRRIRAAIDGRKDENGDERL